MHCFFIAKRRLKKFVVMPATLCHGIVLNFLFLRAASDVQSRFGHLLAETYDALMVLEERPVLIGC